MNLYTYSLPLEFADASFKFVPPYTITTVLHYNKARYVGYILEDTKGDTLDVLSITSLTKYVSENPSEFKNATISPTGCLEIINFTELPCAESFEYESSLELAGSLELSSSLELASSIELSNSLELTSSRQAYEKVKLQRNANSYSFPVEIENANNFDVFIPPYTIVKMLHHEKSHYVGCTLQDKVGNLVDVLSVMDLKRHIEEYPEEFTNVKPNAVGFLGIERVCNLPHSESVVYDFNRATLKEMGLNQGLMDLLEFKLPPEKFYRYTKKSVALTASAKKYLETELDNIDGIGFIMPQPLLMTNDVEINSCTGLYSNLSVKDKTIDFSIVDLSGYDNYSKLFAGSEFDNLSLKPFNLKLQIRKFDLFVGLNCDFLDLKGVDFSKLKSLESLFHDVNIKKLEFDSTLTPEVISAEDFHIFQSSYIGEFDLNFYNKISGEDFIKRRGFLNGLTCEKLLNLEILPLEKAKKLPYFFWGLIVSEFDANKLNLPSLTNPKHLYDNFKCKKFKKTTNPLLELPA